MLRSICLFLLLFCTTVPDAYAHTIRPAVASLTLEKTGALSIEITVNIEAMLVGVESGHTAADVSSNDAAYQELRALGPEELMHEFDNASADFLNSLVIESEVGKLALVVEQVTINEPGDLDLARDSVIELSGTVPEGAQTLVWRWPDQYGSSIVRLFSPAADAPQTEWVQQGEASKPLAVAGLFEAHSAANVFVDYIVIGFKHILPLGIDHILFVLGLFLLSARFRPLLWQVSAFTLAHTITLGLSIYGQINLPATPVEILIALSIAYVGIENCFVSKLKSWRIVLVFAFGLLHGVGFAGVLGDVGLPDESFLTALVGFNVGVEIGQLTVILLAFITLGLFSRKAWYRRLIVIPGSLLISCVGLYWAWERALGLFS